MSIRVVLLFEDWKRMEVVRSETVVPDDSDVASGKEMIWGIREM